MTDSDARIGHEVLVVDRDERVLRGLEKLFGDAGFVVSSRQDAQRALDLLAHKYFTVLLVDYDTLDPSPGLGFLAEVKKRAPRTAVLVLVAKKSFEASVAAFRAGALDVVAKAPEQIGYLRDRVVRLAGEQAVDVQREKLLAEAADVHEEFLKRMLAASREIKDLEDRLAGNQPTAVQDFGPMNLLLCDARPFADELQKELAAQQGFHLARAQSGGEALDTVGRARFQIAVVGDELPDLPATMVLRTLREQHADLIAILLEPPTPRGKGRAQIVEVTRNIPLVEELESAAQVAGSLGPLREAFHAKLRERTYLQAFREKNYEFLRRYADLRQRIQRLVGSQGTEGSVSSGILRSGTSPAPKP